MDVNSDRIQELIERPGESLSIELKRWINPDETSGIAKIVKNALALRNHGGGYIVIGFDDKTFKPDIENIPVNVREQFHIDKIQGEISKYSSEPFEISVAFPERAGQAYPVIIIPGGIKTPVATKSELCEGGKQIIKANTVYVRSLRANNTPSTTQALWKDWTKIVEVCFDNREADIGRFLRRHLSGLKPEIIHEFALAISQSTNPEPTIEEFLEGYLQESQKRYESVVSERGLELPDKGVWEIALKFVGTIPEHSTNKDFLNLLDSSNPDYTGWPVWVDSRGFSTVASRPYVANGIWESLIAEKFIGCEVDFMRLDPKGIFYLRRTLQDDIEGSSRAPKPRTELDFGLPIVRTAEAMAVGIAFGKAMGCDQEKTHLSFAFRWTKLKGRELTSWANPGRYISRGQPAYQDKVLAFVSLPLDTPLSALGDYVKRVVDPLFEIFGGQLIGAQVIDDLTQKLINRNV